jgi:hypothetical protein
VATVSKEVAATLPRTFRGWPTHFAWDGTPVGHHVEIAELGEWLETRLGANPALALAQRLGFERYATLLAVRLAADEG